MAGKKPLRVFRAHLLGRYHLQENETFSIEKAHSLVTTHRPKQDHTRTKTKIKLYKDCIRLLQGSFFSDIPPPLVYPFNNVVRFFVFKADPRVLALGVSDKGKKVFVLLRFKSLVHNNVVCDEIEKMKGPGVTSSYETPVILETDEMKETQVTDTFYADPVVRYEELPPPADRQVDEPMVAVHAQRPVESGVVIAYDRLNQSTDNGDVRYIDCEIIDDNQELRPKKVRQDHSSPVILRTNQPNSGDKSLWEEDIKYITYNPRIGSMVTENGPIYMYTAHQITPEYRGYSMCVSSSSDDGSSSSSSDGEGKTARMSLNGPDEGQYDLAGPSMNEHSYVNVGDTNGGAGTSADEHSYLVGGTGTSYGLDGGASYGVSGGASFGVTNPGFRADY